MLIFVTIENLDKMKNYHKYSCYFFLNGKL